MFLKSDSVHKFLQTEFIIKSKKTSFIAQIYFISNINNFKSILLDDVLYVMPKNA